MSKRFKPPPLIQVGRDWVAHKEAWRLSRTPRDQWQPQDWIYRVRTLEDSNANLHTRLMIAERELLECRIKLARGPERAALERWLDIVNRNGLHGLGRWLAMTRVNRGGRPITDQDRANQARAEQAYAIRLDMERETGQRVTHEQALAVLFMRNGKSMLSAYRDRKTLSRMKKLHAAKRKTSGT